jgi:hypothetical protein
MGGSGWVSILIGGRKESVAVLGRKMAEIQLRGREEWLKEQGED